MSNVTVKGSIINIDTSVKVQDFGSLKEAIEYSHTEGKVLFYKVLGAQFIKSLNPLDFTYRSRMAELPVRQFITAGSAHETVPAQSIFTPVFVDALRYGLGDLTGDGYVTGQELGLYLQNKVPQHTNQTPQDQARRIQEQNEQDVIKRRKAKERDRKKAAHLASLQPSAVTN